MQKEKIIHRFNAGAKTYDSAADVQVVAAKNLKNYLTEIPAKNILEIGCGTGLFSRYLMKQFPEAIITLNDISLEMIKVSTERFGKNANIKFLCEDAEQLSLAASYDLVVSNMMLHWVSDISTFIKLVMQSLVPGGQFLFTLLGSNTLKEWHNACASINLQSGILDFPTLKAIKNYHADISTDTVNHRVTYANAYSLLRTLKEIGGVATNANYEMLSTGELRNLLRKYDSEFDVNYEIIYGRISK